MEPIIGRIYIDKKTIATRKLLEIHKEYLIMTDFWELTRVITLEVFTLRYIDYYAEYLER